LNYLNETAKVWRLSDEGWSDQSVPRKVERDRSICPALNISRRETRKLTPLTHFDKVCSGLTASIDKSNWTEISAPPPILDPTTF
jgi:hypothetical protein